MTESEWLASEDPAAMLANPVPYRDKVSDRRQRLFVEACRHIENIPSSFRYDLATPDGLRSAVTIWRSASVSVSNAIRAAILRDLLGNPWRPVTLPPGPKCWACQGYGTLLGSAGDRCNPTCDVCEGAGHKPSPWLTADVVRLATAAYEDRREDGTLDPGCLLALSDALEEAGCPATVTCHACNGTGGWQANSTFVPCELCDGDDETMWGKLPHHLLAHLRDPGPHYRGCWAVDLILGES